MRPGPLPLLLLSLLAACTATRPDAREAHDPVAEAIRDRQKVIDYQAVTANGATGQLIEHHDWIYFKEPGAPYRRVVPGRCPQWYNGHTKDRFLVFLPLGYDGVSEVWLASTRGQLIGKLAEGRLNINSSPHLAPSLDQFVHLVRPTTTVAGNISRVDLVVFPTNVDQPLERRTLYTTAAHEWITDLRFEDEATVTFFLGWHDASNQTQQQRHITLKVK